MAETATKDDLGSLLRLIDDTFGIDRVLADRGRDVVEPYYAQSGLAFEALYAGTGCMHLALCPGAEFSFDGYKGQPLAIAKEAAEIGARRILELGCGKGFNTLVLAQTLPEAEIVGSDLIDAHLRRGRIEAQKAGVTNVTYAQADFQTGIGAAGDMDLIFAVEALSFARDLDHVAQSVAAALRPGGRFVMFDVQALTVIDGLPDDLAQATRLYETSVALTHGVHAAGAWEAALQRAGLTVEGTTDMTRDIGPGIRRMQGMALNLLGDWKKRFAIKALPKYLTRNGVNALLGPLVYRLPKGRPDAALSYQKITATKPKA